MQLMLFGHQVYFYIWEVSGKMWIIVVSCLAHREASLTSNSQPALCLTVVVVGHPRGQGGVPLTWRISRDHMSTSYGSAGEEEPELLSTPGKGGIFLHGSTLSGLLVTGSGETHWAVSQELANPGSQSLIPCPSHHFLAKIGQMREGLATH